MTLVEIVQSKARAHGIHQFGRFMIPREHVDFVAARLQDFTATLDAFGPAHLITGGDIVVGLERQQSFERLPIVVNIGEDDELHRPDLNPDPIYFWMPDRSWATTTASCPALSRN